MKYLGFTFTEKPHSELAFLEHKSGPNVLLWKTTDKTNTNFFLNWKEHHAIGFKTNKIEELRKKLEDAGTKVTDVKDEGPVGKFLYFYDPNDNYFYAYQYPNN